MSLQEGPTQDSQNPEDEAVTFSTKSANNREYNCFLVRPKSRVEQRGSSNRAPATDVCVTTLYRCAGASLSAQHATCHSSL